MLISPAEAAHFTPPTGSTAGGTALLIILGGIVFLAFAYSRWKKWRARDSKGESEGP